MKLVRVFRSQIKSKLAVLSLPGAVNPAGNSKEYQIISFMEKENETILKVSRQHFKGMNPSIIANLRGISSSASLSLLLGFQNPQINYSNLHVRKFLDPLSSQPWTPRKTHIVDACKEINKFVSVNHAELNYKESILEDLINFLEDLLRRLKQRKAFVL